MAVRRRATGSARRMSGCAHPKVSLDARLSLDELDLRASWSFEIREVDDGAAGELERPRLGGELHVLQFQLGDPRREVFRAPADVIDGVALARRRVATLNENPYAAPRRALEAILELAGDAAELVLVPGERRHRIRRAQMHMMQPELRGILHDLDPRAPRIFDVPELEEPRHVAHRRHDLHAGGLELLHRRVEIGEREAEVIDRAAGAWQAFVVLQEDETRVAEHQAIGCL